MILPELWEQFSVRLTAKSFTFVILLRSYGNLAQACTKSSHFMYLRSVKINAWAGRETKKLVGWKGATCKRISSAWLSTPKSGSLLDPSRLFDDDSLKNRKGFWDVIISVIQKMPWEALMLLSYCISAVCRQITKGECWTTLEKLTFLRIHSFV